MKTATPQDPVTMDEIRSLAEAGFGDMVKAVVDIEREIMLLGAEMHADEEADLLGSGSRQLDLWGMNLYPGLTESEWIEFDSMINLRPSWGNRSRGIDDPNTREKVSSLVMRLVRQ